MGFFLCLPHHMTLQRLDRCANNTGNGCLGFSCTYVKKKKQRWRQIFFFKLMVLSFCSCDRGASVKKLWDEVTRQRRKFQNQTQTNPAVSNMTAGLNQRLWQRLKDQELHQTDRYSMIEGSLPTPHVDSSFHHCNSGLFKKARRCLPGVDKHVGEEAPCLLSALRLVREGAVPDALIQGDPLLLRPPHRVVDKHCQLMKDRECTQKVSLEVGQIILFWCLTSCLRLAAAAGMRAEAEPRTAEKIKAWRTNQKYRCCMLNRAHKIPQCAARTSERTYL